jgi:hypothetical protein
LTPVIRTTLPAASTIFEPEVDQYPSPAADALLDSATTTPIDSKIARSVYRGRRFMTVLQDRATGATALIRVATRGVCTIPTAHAIDLIAAGA